MGVYKNASAKFFDARCSAGARSGQPASTHIGTYDTAVAAAVAYAKFRNELRESGATADDDATAGVSNGSLSVEGRRAPHPSPTRPLHQLGHSFGGQQPSRKRPAHHPAHRVHPIAAVASAHAVHLPKQPRAEPSLLEGRGAPHRESRVGPEWQLVRAHSLDLTRLDLSWPDLT
jgi:hypothetical protein